MELTKKHLVVLGLVIALIPILYFTVLKTAPSPLTVSSPDSSGGIGPFELKLTLSEPPALNRTVTATVTLRNRVQKAYSNSSIEIILFKRALPYSYDAGYNVWERMLWRGDLPAEGVQTATGEVKVEEPGLYILYARGRFYKSGAIKFSEYTGVALNVTENATAVSTEGRAFLEPEPPRPPSIPYVVKMDLEGVPAENRPVNLRVTIASLMDVRNATFKIFLPEGFELVSGDLVWQGDLQKGMEEGEVRGLGVALDKLPETALLRVSEDKKVRMRATIRANRTGDARIFIFPSQEPPTKVDCDLQGLYRPHPEGGGWQAVSLGGCLNIRVYNESYGIFSEQRLPPEPERRRIPSPTSVPVPPGFTPPPPFGR